MYLLNESSMLRAKHGFLHFYEREYVSTAFGIAVTIRRSYQICIVKPDCSIVELHFKGLKLDSVLVKLV